MMHLSAATLDQWPSLRMSPRVRRWSWGSTQWPQQQHWEAPAGQMYPTVKPADLHAKRCHNGPEECPITDVAKVKRSLPLWMDKIHVLRPQVCCWTSGRRGGGVCFRSVCWRAADASVKRRPYLFPPSSAAFVSAFIWTSNESNYITDPRQEFGKLIYEHRVRQVMCVLMLTLYEAIKTGEHGNGRGECMWLMLTLLFTVVLK